MDLENGFTVNRLWAPLGEKEMHVSCGEKSRGDWHSGIEHAAHLGHHQYHTRVIGGGNTLIPCRCLKT